MARIAENTVIVDGQEYKPGDMIPDFKSIKCVDTREPRKYQGLSADVSVLNDVIAKYASGGASCFMSDTGEYYEYDRKEKTWKLITNITERGFDSEKAYGALKHMLKNVTVSDEKIQSAVTDYLTVNPVLPGATTEQAQQIEQNKTDVASLKEETGSLKEETGSLKEDLSNKITKFYASNQGGTHITDSDNGKIQDMMIYGRSSQDGTPTPENPVEIKSVVNPTVKVTNEDGLKVQSVTLNNITLNAIPVSSGGNVTIGGQQYISDYVDIEKGKLYRKVKRLNLKDANDTSIAHSFHSNGNGYLSFSLSFIGIANKEHRPISNRYKGSGWTDKSGYAYTPGGNDIIFVDDRFTDRQTAIKLVQDTYVIYALSSQTEEDLSLEQIKSLKSLSTYYPITNISVNSEQLDGYTVFNYPISMANGWNYVKKQLNDNRDYIYDMDMQSAEAYVNSEYAVALTELEV